MATFTSHSSLGNPSLWLQDLAAFFLGVKACIKAAAPWRDAQRLTNMGMVSLQQHTGTGLT